MLLALILVSVYAYVLTGYLVVQKISDPYQEYPWFSWDRWLAGALWWFIPMLWLYDCACQKIQTAWARFKLKRITTKLGAKANPGE